MKQQKSHYCAISWQGTCLLTPYVFAITCSCAWHQIELKSSEIQGRVLPTFRLIVLCLPLVPSSPRDTLLFLDCFTLKIKKHRLIETSQNSQLTTWRKVSVTDVSEPHSDILYSLSATAYRMTSMRKIAEAPPLFWNPHKKRYCYCLLFVSTNDIYRVSQEERTKLRESAPYVKLYRYNPKHLYPKLNGYGDNGQRKVWTPCISA